MISIRPSTLCRLAAISLLIITLCLSSQAQHKRRSSAKPKPATTSAPPAKPSTLVSCGVSLRVPPGWELTAAKPRETKIVASAAVTPESSTTGAAEAPGASSTADKIAPPTALPSGEPDPAAPIPTCSFVLAPKAPSAIVKSTEAEAPVGEMELRVLDGDLDSAAANLFQKDDQGWYFQDSKGSRSNAKLTKQKTMQILSSVVVLRCYDRSGKSRGLCEMNKYVYSNGRRNLLITAGPYLGETEFAVLNSVRFVGSPASGTRKKTR